MKTEDRKEEGNVKTEGEVKTETLLTVNKTNKLLYTLNFKNFRKTKHMETNQIVESKQCQIPKKKYMYIYKNLNQILQLFFGFFS